VYTGPPARRRGRPARNNSDAPAQLDCALEDELEDKPSVGAIASAVVEHAYTQPTAAARIPASCTPAPPPPAPGLASATPPGADQQAALLSLLTSIDWTRVGAAAAAAGSTSGAPNPAQPLVDALRAIAAGAGAGAEPDASAGVATRIGMTTEVERSPLPAPPPLVPVGLGADAWPPAADGHAGSDATLVPSSPGFASSSARGSSPATARALVFASTSDASADDVASDTDDEIVFLEPRAVDRTAFARRSSVGPPAPKSDDWAAPAGLLRPLARPAARPVARPAASTRKRRRASFSPEPEPEPARERSPTRVRKRPAPGAPRSDPVLTAPDFFSARAPPAPAPAPHAQTSPARTRRGLFAGMGPPGSPSPA
jgi:hypothetical protein